MTLIFYQCSRHYKDDNDRTTRVYHKAVTASDEAFIWQILTYYENYWAGVGNDEDDSLENSSNGKRGQKQGFIKTASKTLETYGKYITLVGESRKAPNTKLWSEKLMTLAKQKSNSQQKKQRKTNVIGTDHRYHCCRGTLDDVHKLKFV